MVEFGLLILSVFFYQLFIPVFFLFVEFVLLFISLTSDNSCDSSWPWPSTTGLLQDCEFTFLTPLCFFVL